MNNDKIFLYDISENKRWRRHIYKRINEAVDIGLIRDIERSNLRFNIFLNGKYNESYLDILDPEESISIYVNDSCNKKGWVLRDDLFPDIAQWIFDNNCFVRCFLTCEAGYSKLGDKSIINDKNLGKIIYNNKNLFFNINICKSTIDNILYILRAGRSYRVLSIIHDGNDSCIPVSSGYFLCDAFDGDTLIISKMY